MGGKGSYQQPAMSLPARQDFWTHMVNLGKIAPPPSPATQASQQTAPTRGGLGALGTGEGTEEVSKMDPSVGGTKVDYEDAKASGQTQNVSTSNRSRDAALSRSLLDEDEEDTSPI